MTNYYLYEQLPCTATTNSPDYSRRTLFANVPILPTTNIAVVHTTHILHYYTYYINNECFNNADNNNNN